MYWIFSMKVHIPVMQYYHRFSIKDLVKHWSFSQEGIEGGDQASSSYSAILHMLFEHYRDLYKQWNDYVTMPAIAV